MLRGLDIKKPLEIEQMLECPDHDHVHDIIESVDSDASDQFFTEASSESSGSDLEESSDEEIEIPEESNISKTLSDNTTRTVIVLVLSLLIMQSACNHETYLTPVLVHTQAFSQLVAFYNLGEDYCPSYQIAHKAFLEKLNSEDNEKYPIVYL